MQGSTCYGHNMKVPKKVTDLPEGTNPQLTHYIPVHDGTGLKRVLLSYIKTLVNVVTWGNIGGTLSNQTDLQNALNAKQASLGFTPEDSANKKLSLTDNSDTYYPSQKAVKTAVDAKISKAAGTTYTTNTILTLTSAEYAAIGTKDANTLYFIV